MRATGITRRLDKLGRITLPMELRRSMEIGDSDLLEVFVEGNNIVMQKVERGCMLCGQVKDTVAFKAKRVCRNCLKDLHAL